MKYFCVVDKDYGESHSFVDGMLQKVILSQYAGSCIVYAAPKVGGANRSFSRAGCVAMPFRRKGFGRIGFPVSVIRYFLKNYSIQKDVVVFVRNEPLVLFFFCLLKRFLSKRFYLVFQSSFPHELYSGNKFSRPIALYLFKTALVNCDRLLVVSGRARERVLRYTKSFSLENISVIPLCCDLDPFPRAGFDGLVKPIKFVYIGSVAAHRRLDVVLAAFHDVLNGGARFEFNLYGATKEEFLRHYPASKAEVEVLEASKSLNFGGVVRRAELPEMLSKCDVGLNLIPPIEMYVESSSTKLGEYLAQGLPVLSSLDIPYHEDVHATPNLGWLVGFDRQLIAQKLIEVISLGRTSIDAMRSDCVQYSVQNMQYEAYAHLLFFSPGGSSGSGVAQ